MGVCEKYEITTSGGEEVDDTFTLKLGTTLSITDVLHIPRKKFLINNGSILIGKQGTKDDGTIVNEVTIDNEGIYKNLGTLVNRGTIDNKGTILVLQGKIVNYGRIKNFASIFNYQDGTIANVGTINGVPEETPP